MNRHAPENRFSVNWAETTNIGIGNLNGIELVVDFLKDNHPR